MQPVLGLLSAEGGGFQLFNYNDWTLSLWTAIILVVSLPAMWVFVFKPIAQALEERDHKAEEAVKAAQAAKQAAEAAQAQCEAQLSGVRAEAQKILAQAQTTAEARFKEITGQAQDEASKTLEKARAEIEREKTKALFEIREEVVGLTIGAAEKVLSRKVGDEDAKRFVRDMVGQVQTMK